MMRGPLHPRQQIHRSVRLVHGLPSNQTNLMVLLGENGTGYLQWFEIQAYLDSGVGC